MLKAVASRITMEGALRKQPIREGIQNPRCETPSNFCSNTVFVGPLSVALAGLSSEIISPKHPWVAGKQKEAAKVHAMRRRRANMDTDTYVLMEPGKNEEFVSEEELRVRLKGWLEDWPEGRALPPDLARFETIDDAISYLVKSVCELEIDGDVGSIQWFQVRLE